MTRLHSAKKFNSTTAKTLFIISTAVNPYKALVQLETESIEDVAMKDAPSQTGSESTTSGSGAIDPPPGNGDEVHGSGLNNVQDEDMVNFEDPKLTLPPCLAKRFLKRCFEMMIILLFCG